MRSPRLVLVGAVAFIAAVTGCGVSPQVRSETKETQPPMSQAQTVNPLVAADVALARELRFIVGAVAQEASKATEPPRTVYTAPPSTVPTAPTSSPFPCMATAETSNVAAMGPTYWTVYGMVRDIIEDYGTPEEQAAVFSGTATLGQQTDIASRFAADHGFGGWGPRTREVCHL